MAAPAAAEVERKREDRNANLLSRELGMPPTSPKNSKMTSMIKLDLSHSSKSDDDTMPPD